MRRVKGMLAFIAIATLLQSGTPLHGQTLLTCLSQGTITIGHFNEGGAEVGEFCRYLVRHGIQPVFQNFGNIGAAGTAKNAAAALEEGRVHLIWLGTAALATLIENSTLRAKVLAVSDFTVFQVISSDPKAVLVDSSFAPTDVMVKSGRSETFADTLFIAINKPTPRCLGGARIGCQIRPQQGDPEGMFTGALASFLGQVLSEAVIVGSSPFSPTSPRDPVKEILYVAKQARLVGIPPATVRAMSTVHGMYAEVSIPKDYYGEGIPKENIPTAGDPRLLISAIPRLGAPAPAPGTPAPAPGTPAPAPGAPAPAPRAPAPAGRPAPDLGPITEALSKDRRMSPEYLMIALRTLNVLAVSLGDRVVLDPALRAMQTGSLGSVLGGARVSERQDLDPLSGRGSVIEVAVAVADFNANCCSEFGTSTRSIRSGDVFGPGSDNLIGRRSKDVRGLDVVVGQGGEVIGLLENLRLDSRLPGFTLGQLEEFRVGGSGGGSSGSVEHERNGDK